MQIFIYFSEKISQEIFLRDFPLCALHMRYNYFVIYYFVLQYYK